MTGEQIAELRQWCNSDSYETPDADAILKALDEREALLEAVRAAEWGGEAGFEAGTCPVCGGEKHLHLMQAARLGHRSDCALAAAIAKAES